MKERALSPTFMVILALAAWVSVSAVAGQELPAEVLSYPDAIYTNGVIMTLDDHRMNDNPGTMFQAMAVRDGKDPSPGFPGLHPENERPEYPSRGRGGQDDYARVR